MEIYHGSTVIVEKPEIRTEKFNKDFYFGFYCTGLDFIAACRSGVPHDYDIVEGPMANDTIYNYVQDFLDKMLSREQFWGLAKFKNPTHRINFHTDAALATLLFVRGEEVHE